MPIYKCILRYHESSSGMDWTITNHIAEFTVADVSLAANNWNTAYLACCAQSVSIIDCRISDVDVYRDMNVIARNAFAQQDGLKVGLPTEIASYGQWRGFGKVANMGSAAWKLHGISEDFVISSRLNSTTALIIALNDASLDYFRQFRPEAGEHVPALPTTEEFLYGTLTGMYFRRLGRPFGLPGQSQ